jgi:hypothetical protein
MAPFSRKVPQLLNVRLVAEGTRVVVLQPQGAPIAGIISGVRTATNLRPYVVICDDGARVYASSYHLALEDDAARTPLGRPPADRV